MRVIKESKAALLELTKLIAERQVIPLVGSGLSVAAGYPTWNELLETLHRHVLGSETTAQEKHVGGKYIGRLKEVTDVLWRAQEYRRLLGEARFTTVMKEVFSERKLPAGSPLRALAALDFRHYLTTNYDSLIEQALNARRLKFERLVWGSQNDAGAAATFVRQLTSATAPRRVVYLHGRFDDPQTCILADSDYFKRYIATDETQKRLFAVFLTQSVLFVGFSMSDPELTALLRVVRGLFQHVAPWHYAIMPLPLGERVEVATAYYQYRYGMTPIFYEPTPKHEGLTEVLAMLGGEAPAALQPKARSRRARSAPDRAASEKAIAKLETENPDDPNKGQFGGRSRVAGWALSAQVAASDDPEWFAVELTVTAPKRRLRDRTVVFHLHPSFSAGTERRTLKNRKATLDRLAYGAFTVGVEADKGAVRLELDLATVKRAPALFKQR